MHAFKSKNEEQICSVRSEKNGKKEHYNLQYED